MLELASGERGRQLLVAIHVSEDRGIVLPAERYFVAFVAETPHQFALAEHIVAVGDEQPPFAAAEVLQVVQAEGAGDSQRSAHPPLVHRPVRLAGVFDHMQAVLLGDGENRVHVSRAAVNVDGNDRPGPLGDCRFDLGRVERVVPRLDVDEDGNRHLVQDARGRGEERVGGHNHLVAGADIERRQCHVERRRAAASGQAVFRAGELGEFLLQSDGLGPVGAGDDPAVEHFSNELAVIFGNYRPVQIVSPLQDRGAATYRKLFRHQTISFDGTRVILYQDAVSLTV